MNFMEASVFHVLSAAAAAVVIARRMLKDARMPLCHSQAVIVLGVESCGRPNVAVGVENPGDFGVCAATLSLRDRESSAPSPLSAF
jgi:hypothetical protein